MLLLAALLALQCPDGAPPPCRTRPAPITIAVAPFANNSSDTSDAYLASSISEDVMSQLAGAGGVRLVGERGLAAYRLSGSVRRQGQRLSVSAQLLRPSDSRVVWRLSLTRPTRDLGWIPDSVARGALASIGLRPVARRARPDPVLYDLYARGRFHLVRRTQPGVARAWELFNQALAQDSAFALAWFGLAEALVRASVWRFNVPGVPADSMVQRLVVVTERAIELDSLSSLGWYVRGRVLINIDPTSRTEAIRALRRAIALDSSYAPAWQQLGLALDETGDREGALHAYRRSLDLPSTDIESINFLALHHYWWRSYDSAQSSVDLALASDPAHVLTREVAGDVALARGRIADAESHFEAAFRLATAPDIRGFAGLARVAILRGDTARARLLAAEAESITGSGRLASHAAVQLAGVYLALGDVDRAFSWLERYLPRRDLHFRLHLRFEPGLDPLRGDPRFQALLR